MCTGITIRPEDGSVIFARTLEFATEVHSNAIVIPRGRVYQGTASLNSTSSEPTPAIPGKSWTTKYATVGMNYMNTNQVLDGMNEMGLQVGTFYFPDSVSYQIADNEEEVANALSPHEFATFLLGTCSTVDEAVEAAKKVKVTNTKFEPFGIVVPLHFMLTDFNKNTTASEIDTMGNSIVLEHVDKHLKVHNNPYGVLTNAPTFDWHETNLRNYIGLSVTNLNSINIANQTLSGLGEGTGMLGLPGDFSTVSRFIRATIFSHAAQSQAKKYNRLNKAQDGIFTAFHLLNQFDIPKGSIMTTVPPGIGNPKKKDHPDYTQWTIAADLTNKIYYYRTYENSQIRAIHFDALHLDAEEIVQIPLVGPHETYADVSLTSEPWTS